MVTFTLHLPSRNTPFMLALIYQHQPDPSWDSRWPGCQAGLKYFSRTLGGEKSDLPGWIKRREADVKYMVIWAHDWEYLWLIYG